MVMVSQFNYETNSWDFNPALQAAIPDEPQNPGTNATSQLPLCKHPCENSPLTCTL